MSKRLLFPFDSELMTTHTLDWWEEGFGFLTFYKVEEEIALNHYLGLADDNKAYLPL